jgi:multiple sugar transport system ATP-binding protein
MAQVSLRNLRKSYAGLEIIHGVSCEIEDGELIVVVGPSGCGKSTLLRMVAGLEEISAGEVAIGGRVVNAVEPKDRDIAMVFQNYALYPHMSVFGNMAYGLKIRGLSKSEIAERVGRAAAILQLESLLDRKPRALSGGQRQRVAMGRAIVRDPQVFLFDEPLSNLDAKLRVQMRVEIKKLQQSLATTSIYVTHDQVEAMTLADRLIVMNAGVAEQIGAPIELYERPESIFVGGFIGSPAMNFLPCRIEETAGALSMRLSETLTLPIPVSRTACYRPHAQKELVLGLRPEHITEARAHREPGTAEFTVPVEVIEPMGMETMVYFSVNGTEISARVNPADAQQPGETMRFTADLRHMHLIDPATNLVIEVPPETRGDAQSNAAAALRRSAG